MKRTTTRIALAAAALAVVAAVAAVAQAAGMSTDDFAETEGTAAYTESTGESAIGPVSPSSDDLTRAQAVLADLVAEYPVLEGTTVEFGDAHGYQAVSYYRTGRIVVSRSHAADIERILTHEVWHVIDYRDNGVIDWGENLPPADASSFAD